MENGAEMAIFRTIDWLESLENTMYFIGSNPPFLRLKGILAKPTKIEKKDFVWLFMRLFNLEKMEKNR